MMALVVLAEENERYNSFAMRNQEDRCQLEAITMFSDGALGVYVRVSLISIAGI